MKKIITLFLVSFFLLALNSRSNSQISSFPYVATGDNTIGWNVIQGPVLWYLGPVTSNPAGVSNDLALVCNFYGQGTGVEGLVVSPAFNFTALSNPVLHFYVAYRTLNSQNDSLQVLISIDGGATFVDTPVPYRKADNSNPSLATLNPSHTEFNPSAPSQWRHETIDLSAYAGMNNVFIAFRGRSDFGNNLWIDDFIVTNADGYCTSNVTAAGSYSCNPILSVNMNTTGNPSGGVMSVTEHLNQYPVPTQATPDIMTNSTATTHDGSIFTPNIVAPDAWFTVSYTGNDKSGYANYNLSVNVSGFISVLDISKLYLMKRADLTGSWVCLNTTVSGSTLTASGLSTFCDFAVGGDSLQNPLPVELTSFVSLVNGNDVTLNWVTASEINNSGFEIERSTSNGNWSKIGNVAGNGTTETGKNYSFTDRNIASGIYNYRLKQIDFNGNFEYFNLSNEVNVGVPSKFNLSQNYPNPFNPTTNLEFGISELGFVSLKVYNASGKEVATLVNEIKPAGYYSVNFNGSSLSSGVYFYRLNAGDFTATKKMTLLK